jgi:anti-sigma B factor antagonist
MSDLHIEHQHDRREASLQAGLFAVGGHDAGAPILASADITDADAEALFTIARDRGLGVDVISGSGEIDISTAPLLAEALGNAVTQGDAAVVVDLSQVTFMDSSGVHVLIMTAKHLAAQHRGLSIACRDGSAVHRLLAIVGLLDTLSIYPSVRGALAAGGTSSTRR